MFLLSLGAAAEEPRHWSSSQPPRWAWSYLCHLLDAQSYRSDWCCAPRSASPPQFWLPGRRCGRWFSRWRQSYSEIPSWWSWALSASALRTRWGRWSEWAFWSGCSCSTPAHRGSRSCGLCAARTSASAMPANGTNSARLVLATLYINQLTHAHFL